MRIKTFVFRPSTVRVSPGAEVTWVNEDDITHTVTSGRAREQGIPGASEDVPAKPDGLFDGELDGAGSMFTFTPDEPGRFTYYCDIHAGMTGTVVAR